MTPLSSSRACAIGSSSSCDSGSCFCCLLLSGEATSNTLLPTLSWKLARGSAGSGLGDGGLLWMARCPLVAKLFGGLAFSSIFLREEAVHVLRALGVRAGGSTSCLLFLLANGLLKKPLFFCTEPSSIGLGSGSGDCGIGLPGDAEPLGGSMLENDVGFEYSLCESLLAGRAGLGFELRSDGASMRQNCVIPSAG